MEYIVVIAMPTSMCGVRIRGFQMSIRILYMLNRPVLASLPQSPESEISHQFRRLRMVPNLTLSDPE